MPIFQDAPDLKDLAAQLVVKIEHLAHVEVEDILFLWELETEPKAYAECYQWGKHPIGFFTDKRYGIVVYKSNVDYMTPSQLTMLLLHELMHIPERKTLIEHDRQDFRYLLGISLDWAEPGADVPDLLEG